MRGEVIYSYRELFLKWRKNCIFFFRDRVSDDGEVENVGEREGIMGGVRF